MNYLKCIKLSILSAFVGLFLLAGCSTSKNANQYFQGGYKTDNQSLYDSIVKLDSVFFETYNTCSIHLREYGAFFSDSIEFYHDNGGLMTSKQDIIDATKRNICGKVTRELVKGSIEVYPIRDYGAIEIGLHKFHNNQEPPGSISKVGRFVIVWQKTGNEWKIKRVISLH